MQKAQLLFYDRMVRADGSIIEMKIWRVPEPVRPSDHDLKYSLFYGKPGERIVGYDNERGKGDHRHYGRREEAYSFQGPEKLIADFLADVEAAEKGGV
jgi:hypothetical protein